MLTSLYRNRIAAQAIELARDDPLLVKEVIARLRQSGEIERDDLVYLDRIAALDLTRLAQPGDHFLDQQWVIPGEFNRQGSNADRKSVV